jgi:UDP-N-acetylglucosamine 2-epimerase (non-hydrolysing)
MGCSVACVVGTRPEAVKMAPLILRLRREGSDFHCRVISTGQHRDLLHRGLADFGLRADFDLGVMRAGQSLGELTGRTLTALGETLRRERPDVVLAQGDTTTVLCAALASYYERIPFGHVEAGLRTGRDEPFPEEKNRVLAGQLANLHFAPSERACANLVREGIDPAAIFLTGNTVIDALLMISVRIPPRIDRDPKRRFLLVTAHRRENWGRPMEQIGLALRELAERHRDLAVVFPIHPNPAVRETILRVLGGQERVELIDPVGYREFVALMKSAHLVLTDSGGIQEEAPAMGKPVLLLRDATERPEAVAAGTVQLVGTRREAIVQAVERLWCSREAYDRFARVVNPYGDGQAAERIYRILAERFEIDPGAEPAGLSDWPLQCSGPLPRGLQTAAGELASAAPALLDSGHAGPHVSAPAR